MKRNTIIMVLILGVLLGLAGCKKKEPEAPSSMPEPSVVSSEPLPEMDDTTLYNGKTLAQYYRENEDTIGWLTIPGTRTDNVVMLGADKDYAYGVNHYLHYSFDGRNTTAGELYIDYRSAITAAGMNQNMVIYGHHMIDGTMLAGLDKYKSKSFFEDHQYITFNTLWEKHHFRVFTVFTVNLKTEYGSSFDYRQPSYTGEAFASFVKELKDRQYYETGVEIDENSRIVTLSTCTYPTGNPKTDDARLVVMARMCTEEEEAALAQTETPDTAASVGTPS